MGDRARIGHRDFKHVACHQGSRVGETAVGERCAVIHLGVGVGGNRNRSGGDRRDGHVTIHHREVDRGEVLVRVGKMALRETHVLRSHVCARSRSRGGAMHIGSGIIAIPSAGIHRVAGHGLGRAVIHLTVVITRDGHRDRIHRIDRQLTINHRDIVIGGRGVRVQRVSE